MTTQEIANKLVELCRQGNFEKAQADLYSKDVVVVEAEGAPDRVTKGLDNVHEKGKQFEQTVEAIHKNEVSDPVVAGDYFSCAMRSVMVFKGNPARIDMNEVCVYQVSDGKISRVEFFYTISQEFLDQ